MNFFLINKVISKSEIQPLRNGMYQWNLLNVLSADLAGDDADRQIKFDFFESAKSGKH
jgi:hypothetical protein